MAKCEFLKREAVYLGLKIDAEGLHPADEKVEAVKRAPVPQNVKELRSFLGMVQYYHSFLPHLAITLAPLHELLKKGVQSAWTRECQQAYEAGKQNLTSDTLLVHYGGNRGPQTYVVRTGHKTRYVYNDHLIRAHDDVPDDVSEPEVLITRNWRQNGGRRLRWPFKNGRPHNSKMYGIKQKEQIYNIWVARWPLADLPMRKAPTAELTGVVIFYIEATNDLPTLSLWMP